MPSGPLQPVTFDEFGDAIGRAATVLRANATASGLSAPVPTCPGWSVLDLVTHVGMAHRWAASHVRGHPIDAASAQSLERQGRDHPDVLGWFDDGATALLQALVDAPEDLDVFVFLKNAPSPRRFWTRRMAHEPTIHAVDALSARLGRAPRPDETSFPAVLAADGIDELVRGFVPRRREGLHPDVETRLLVRPDGGGAAWLMELGPDHPVRSTLLESHDAADVDADHVLTGTTVDLYLRLWSRAAEVPADPAHSAERWWREHVSVRWA
ncbi:MAG: maleylpyruvate isomerase N-terminal domain-containing protein [Micrococcales bacterium]|nr:maleylpyruvate isomerase N-terminal domain-containing protein [Micrococcales bacterium]